MDELKRKLEEFEDSPESHLLDLQDSLVRLILSNMKISLREFEKQFGIPEKEMHNILYCRENLDLSRIAYILHCLEIRVEFVQKCVFPS